jgi:hypothetical protein
VSRVFNFVLKTDSGSAEKPGEVTVRGMSVGHGVRVVLLAVPKINAMHCVVINNLKIDPNYMVGVR